MRDQREFYFRTRAAQLWTGLPPPAAAAVRLHGWLRELAGLAAWLQRCSRSVQHSPSLRSACTPLLALLQLASPHTQFRCCPGGDQYIWIVIPELSDQRARRLLPPQQPPPAAAAAAAIAAAPLLTATSTLAPSIDAASNSTPPATMRRQQQQPASAAGQPPTVSAAFVQAAQTMLEMQRNAEEHNRLAAASGNTSWQR